MESEVGVLLSEGMGGGARERRRGLGEVGRAAG
jgi:hypothetical protein